MSFEIDPRLRDSSIFVDNWSLCWVALKNDKTLPWLYLVPRRENMRELRDLSEADQIAFMRELSIAQQGLIDLYQPTKVNTAALGNMVPQLHVHVFTRFEGDFAWPKPVWAVDWKEIPYSEAEVENEVRKIKGYFDSVRIGDKKACQQ